MRPATLGALAALLLLASNARAITVQTCANIPPEGVGFAGNFAVPFEDTLVLERNPAQAQEARVYLVLGDADNNNEGTLNFTATNTSLNFLQQGEAQVEGGEDELNHVRRVLPAGALVQGANPVQVVLGANGDGFRLYQACVQLTYANPPVGSVAGGTSTASVESFCPDELTEGPANLAVNGTAALDIPITVVLDRAPSAASTATALAVLWDADSFEGGESEGFIALAGASVDTLTTEQPQNDAEYSLFTAVFPAPNLQRGVMGGSVSRRGGFSGYRVHQLCIRVDGLLPDDTVDAGAAPDAAPPVDAGTGPVDANGVDGGPSLVDAGSPGDAATTSPPDAGRDAAVGVDVRFPPLPDAAFPPTPDSGVRPDAATPVVTTDASSGEGVDASEEVQEGDPVDPGAEEAAEATCAHHAVDGGAAPVTLLGALLLLVGRRRR
ncbi:MAG: hypothetical protein AB2A00_16615 [Myxococcota bacterium]